MPAHDRNERAYGVVNNVEQLDTEQIDAYWRRVTETLVHVFGVSASEAPSKVLRFREGLRERPDTVLHSYHSDPFEVAADLAGAAGRLATPDQKRRYIDLQNRPHDDRPDAKSLDRLLPEDLHPRS